MIASENLACEKRPETSKCGSRMKMQRLMTTSQKPKQIVPIQFKGLTLEAYFQKVQVVEIKEEEDIEKHQDDQQNFRIKRLSAKKQRNGDHYKQTESPTEKNTNDNKKFIPDKLIFNKPKFRGTLQLIESENNIAKSSPKSRTTEKLFQERRFTKKLEPLNELQETNKHLKRKQEVAMLYQNDMLISKYAHRFNLDEFLNPSGQKHSKQRIQDIYQKIK